MAKTATEYRCLPYAVSCSLSFFTRARARARARTRTRREHPSHHPGSISPSGFRAET